MDRLDDILGGIALFALLIGGFWLASGFDWPTGADELLQVVR